MNLITILEELHHVSSFRLSIFDTSFNEIAAFPLTISNFCSFLQQKPGVKECCNKCHNRAFDIVKETGEPYIYHCEFGLYEAIAPLYHDNILYGFIKMGQTLNKNLDTSSYIFEKALPFIQNEDLLTEKIKEIPTSTKEQILSCISLMKICAEYISLSNRINLNEKTLAKEIKTYIDSNFQTKISLETLCNHFFYSKPTIMNAFKNTYHKSINRYIQETRLNHAIQLLNNSKESIFTIAKDCGYTDQNYFTKVFIKEFGVTPSQFRKQQTVV